MLHIEKNTVNGTFPNSMEECVDLLREVRWKMYDEVRSSKNSDPHNSFIEEQLTNPCPSHRQEPCAQEN